MVNNHPWPQAMERTLDSQHLYLHDIYTLSSWLIWFISVITSYQCDITERETGKTYVQAQSFQDSRSWLQHMLLDL